MNSAYEVSLSLQLQSILDVIFVNVFVTDAIEIIE